MKKVGKIITKYKKELTIGPILKLVEAIIEVIIPIIIAKVIDNIFTYSIDDKIKIGSIILLITIFSLWQQKVTLFAVYLYCFS